MLLPRFDFYLLLLKPKTPNATIAPPPPREKGKKREKKKRMKSIPHPPIRQPPKLRKISVVDKSRNEEEAFELRSQLEEISILVSMSLSPINLKC